MNAETEAEAPPEIIQSACGRVWHLTGIKEAGSAQSQAQGAPQSRLLLAPKDGEHSLLAFEPESVAQSLALLQSCHFHPGLQTTDRQSDCDNPEYPGFFVAGNGA